MLKEDNIDFWKFNDAPNFIISLIDNRGYSLPFVNLPEPVKLGNNKSTRVHVDQAIFELVISGRVRIVNEQPLVVNPMSAVSVQQNGKKRLILDLRHVNKCLLKQRVKYEDWKVALAYFAREAYMFDSKSGYHVEISEHHQSFRGFSLRPPDSEGETFYVFTVLPFELSTTPYVFTKLLKPLEKH